MTNAQGLPESLVSANDIAAYARDGVVRIRGLLDADWVERMREAIARMQSQEGEFRERYAPQSSGYFHSDKFMWDRDPDFRACAFDSAAPMVAGQLMQAEEVNLFYDHLLVREPGTTSPTPWIRT